MKTALWKGGMTALCTAASVNLFVGATVKIPTVVEKIVTTTFGVGNGLVTAGAVAALQMCIRDSPGRRRQ